MNVSGSSVERASPGRIGRGRRRVVRASLLSGLAVLAMANCGGSDSLEDAGTSAPTSVVATAEGATLTVGELLEAEDQGRSGHNVVVVAMLVDDGTGMRMCEALAESYPPQCGGRSIDVLNPDVIDVELTEDQGVRWTEGPVSLFGWVEGESFFVS